MEVIQVDQREKWNTVVRSFSDWDVYYLNEYARSFQIHGDGRPVLLHIEWGDARLVYIMMQEDLAAFKPFKGVLPEGRYYDWTTPYGYGGPLIEGKITTEWIQKVMEQVTQYAQHHHIVSQFFRFHPLLQNQKEIESCSTVVYMKKTVYMDTTSKEVICANMTSNNRNMVRKAQKNGIQIIMDRGERIEEFMKIYHQTMEHRVADEYYFFERSYFEYIIRNMGDHMILFYAVYGEKIISASIFFYNEQFMHYHLSGTLYEYRNLGATNLLLTEAAFWAAEHGIKRFHLGGGVEEEDSLLRFKKHFNKKGLIDFCIGCNIFMQDVFDNLIELRKAQDADFDEQKPFLIKYRG